MIKQKALSSLASGHIACYGDFQRDSMQRFVKVGLVLLIAVSGEESMARSLKKYKAKRDFKKTKEPAGKKSKKLPKGGKTAKFVIQQHAARAMHYDLRLEIGGTMVSWAIPKGPSLNPKNKRLAIETEDHPMEYNKFEGIIPPGEYGAGPVIIWDRGTYKNVREVDGKIVPMKKCLKEGRIEIFLRGKKLKGSFALVRTGSAAGEKSKWLLIKMRDEYADARRNPVTSEPESVKTGKTIKVWKKKYDALKKKEQKKKKIIYG